MKDGRIHPLPSGRDVDFTRRLMKESVYGDPSKTSWYNRETVTSLGILLHEAQDAPSALLVLRGCRSLYQEGVLTQLHLPMSHEVDTDVREALQRMGIEVAED